MESIHSAKLLDSLQNFTNELYRTVVDEQKGNFRNTYFSPTSIYLGMLATMLGTSGQCRAEIFHALNLTNDIDEASRPVITGQFLASILRPPPKCATGGTTQATEIVGVNRAFLRCNLKLAPEYLKDIEKFYGFDVEYVPFAENTERDRAMINRWINEKMENTVTEFLPPGSVSEDTKFILTNAMYFKGSFARIFNENNTQKDVFYTMNGGKMLLDMMYQTATHAVQELPMARARALKVYFRDLNWSMLLILPNERYGLADTLDYVRKPGRLAEILSGPFKSREVHFYFPRFQLYKGYAMNERKKLTELGIRSVFSPETADFSAICQDKCFFLSQMRHKSIFQVDEDGVSQAPDPLFTGQPAGCNPQIEPFKFDHPFFLAIVAQDKLPVFVGHVVEPEIE